MLNEYLTKCWNLKNSNIDSAYYFAQEVESFAQEKNDSGYVAKGMYYQAILYYFDAEFEQAVTKATESLSFYSSNDAYGRSSIFNLIGLIYSDQDYYELSLQSYLKALQEAKSLDNLHAQANPHHNIGIIHEKMDEYDPALEHYLEALELRKEIGDSSFIYQSYLAIGAVSYLKKDYAQALSYLSMVVKDLEGNEQEKITLNRAQNNLGLVYLDQHKLDSAKLYFSRALALAQEAEDLNGQVKVLVNFSELSLKTQDYNKAIRFAKTSLPIAEEIDARQEQYKLYHILFQAHRAIGNLDSAILFEERSITLKDSVLSEEKLKAIANYEVRYETEKKEKELSQALEAQAQAELKVSKRNNLIVAIIGLLVVLVLLVVFYILRAKYLSEKKLAEVKAEQQRKGVKAVFKAQENERIRIARELHDGIVQQLGGLKLGLQGLFNSPHSEQESKFLNLLDDSTDELRNLSHQIMPKSLEQLGLIPALDDMLQNSIGLSNIKYSFEYFGLKKNQRFAEDAELAVYRITQELVQNIMKHSQATEASIQLIGSPQTLTLLMEDNGKGIDTPEEHSGIGLMNIRSRVNSLKGSMQFDSALKNGTLVSVKLPMLKDSSHD